MDKGYEIGFKDWQILYNNLSEIFREIRELRTLKKNLDSGVIMNISPELVRVLMERDWANG